MEKLLFFDIETEVNPEAVPFFPEPNAPANYKDEAKISEYIAEKKEEQLKNAPLDPDYGRIVAISTRMGPDGVPLAYVVGDSGFEDETSIIKWFWNQFAEARGRGCGYNVIGFDFPYLLRRSFDLGIPVACKPFLAKYRSDPILDLMGILYNWGPAKGLKYICKRYGIENPLPELNGSQVAEMDPDTRRKYVANDVDLTVKLYRRMLGVYF